MFKVTLTLSFASEYNLGWGRVQWELDGSPLSRGSDNCRGYLPSWFILLYQAFVEYLLCTKHSSEISCFFKLKLQCTFHFWVIQLILTC